MKSYILDAAIFVLLIYIHYFSWGGYHIAMVWQLLIMQ